MLFSEKGDIFNLDRSKSTWLNIPLLFDAHFDNGLTAMVQVLASLIRVLRTEVETNIKLPESENLRFIFSANAKYSYIIHNSMLEGIGIFETFPDDDDPLAPKDIYRLEVEEDFRHIF